jgi:hypothetical protein
MVGSPSAVVTKMVAGNAIKMMVTGNGIKIGEQKENAWTNSSPNLTFFTPTQLKL